MLMQESIQSAMTRLRKQTVPAATARLHHCFFVFNTIEVLSHYAG